MVQKVKKFISAMKMILGKLREGNIEFEGVIRNVERRYKETSSDYIREQMEKYMAQQPCPTCKGYRLKKESLAVLIAWSTYCRNNRPFN